MKWSSQHITWCQFDAIKHFKWNWSSPFNYGLFGDNQFCHCFPLCIPSKIRASSRCVPGLVWLFPKRGGRAKLFLLFLDQNGCESDYSPTADRLNGRTRELAFVGSGRAPRRAHVSFTITFLTSDRETALPVVFPPSPFPWRNSEWRRCEGMRPFPCTKVFNVQAPGTPPRCPPWERSCHPHWGWTLPSGGVTLLGSTVMPSASVDLHPESPVTFAPSLSH